jgi:WD40 repeat protein
VSGSDDGVILVVKVKVTLKAKAPAKKAAKRFTPIASLRGHGGPVLSMIGFEREGEQMMLSSAADGGIAVWQMPGVDSSLYDPHGVLTHNRLREIRVHTDAVWSVDILDDLLTGVSASADGSVKAWPIDGGPAQAVGLGGDVPICVKALTAKQFAVGCRSGSIRIIDDGLHQTTVIDAVAPVLRMQAIVEESQIFAVCDDNVLRVVDVEAEEVTNLIDGHGNGMTGVCITPDREFVITTGNDAYTNIWRAGSCTRVDVVKLHSTKFGEGALCCASTGSKAPKMCFATGGSEGSVQVFIKN